MRRSVGFQAYEGRLAVRPRDALGVVARCRRSGTRSPPFGPGWRRRPTMHDLAHDRADRGHLRADAVGQVAGDGREPLLHDLPGGADVGAPVELDVDDRQPDARLAAHGLHAGRPEQRRLERVGDERLDFFRGQARALGHDRRRAAGRGRGTRRSAAWSSGSRRTRATTRLSDHDQRPVAEREADDGVQHRVASV